MKQLLFFLLLTITVTAKEKVHKKITLGAKSKNCEGSGICSIKNEGIMDASFNYDVKNNSLQIAFPGESLQASGNIDKFENASQFKMDEDFELPNELLSELQIPIQSNVIPQGTFPMQYVDNEFVVYIKLQISEP